MTVKVLDAERRRARRRAVAEGIRYAAANGARVINMSLQGDDPDPRVNEAIAAAGAANVLVVVLGRQQRRATSTPSRATRLRSPAPNLIGVAATAPDDGPRPRAATRTSAG